MDTRTLNLSTLKKLGLGILITKVGIGMGVIMISNTAYATEYYRWVDENGVPHFSSTPPANGEAEKVKTKYKPAIENIPEKAKEETQASIEDETALSEEEQRVAQQREEIRAKNCKAARDRVGFLQSDKRIRLVNDDGTFLYLDEAGKAQEIAKAQQILRQFCN